MNFSRFSVGKTESLILFGGDHLIMATRGSQKPCASEHVQIGPMRFRVTEASAFRQLCVVLQTSIE